MEDLTGYISDDRLAVAEFRKRGWSVDLVPWTADVNWSHYDAVLVRSTWDYHKHAERFLAALERIDSETHLLNPFHLVRWNASKTYLIDLEDRGVAIVPTKFGRGLEKQHVESFFLHFGTDRIIIKPVVGAGADLTFLLVRDASAADRELVAATFQDTAFMVQPFVPSVLDEGEYSLFYFEGVFSHAVVKTPKQLDFRVQEEHGGTIRRTEAKPDLEAAARLAVDAVEPPPLYARVDLVRGPTGVWLIMELELIEPSLYLRTNPEAAVRFAEAFDVRMTRAGF